ncbi:hypothetical protein [Thalassotalea algicola]|uniref:hypothetical protein n=1 Tax=Thalassotalea algicola TaxID=2716224 RepID=UPI001B7D581F|nr:hypothetical protein [Thalassotalea algicola]
MAGIRKALPRLAREQQSVPRSEQPKTSSAMLNFRMLKTLSGKDKVSLQIKAKP